MMDERHAIASLPPLDEDAQEDAAFRAKDRAWVALVRLFDEYQESEKLTYAELGRRIRRSRAHVQRWLGSPFNLSLKSLGLLSEGLNADLVIEVRPRMKEFCTNYCHPSEEARAMLQSRCTNFSWMPGPATDPPQAGSLATGTLRTRSVNPVLTDA